MKDKFEIREGKERGNQKIVTSPKPKIKPAPQAAPQPQICYKTGKACKYNCHGLCKDSY